MAIKPPIVRSYNVKATVTAKRSIAKISERKRLSPSARGYDTDWRKLRAQFIGQHPLCLMCAEQGKIVAADHVDHIQTIADHPELRLCWDNLRSLCERCHNTRSATDQAQAKRVTPKRPQTK